VRCTGVLDLEGLRTLYIVLLQREQRSVFSPTAGLRPFARHSLLQYLGGRPFLLLVFRFMNALLHIVQK